MADDWERLGEAVRKRREQLRLAQGEKPPSSATWRKVEHAIDPPYARRSLLAICDALRWHEDSIGRLLEGGEPRLLDQGDPDMDFHADLSDISPEGRAAIMHIIEMERSKQKG